MSYQGQPPYGGYGGPPNSGTGGWSPPPPPGGYGGYGPPQPPASPGSAIAALILNILALVTCYGSIPALIGVILASIALAQNQTDPGNARKLSLGAWICFGVSVLLLVGVILFYLFIIGGALWFSDSPSYY